MRTKLTKRLADQSGVAMPLAVAVLFGVSGLATVAASAGIVSGNQSLRDQRVKRAYQAAVAGLNSARYRTQLMLPASGQCVVRNPSTGTLSNTAVQGDGWCAAQTEDLGDGASYSFTVSQISGNDRTVVATGTMGGVKRRAMLKMTHLSGGSLMFNHALLSDQAFTIENNVNVTGNVGSNGNITTENNAYICGNLTPGPGKAWIKKQNSNLSCGGSSTPATQPFAFPPVDQAGSQTTNDNDRLTRMKLGGANPKDTCSNCSGISWNAATRVLEMGNNATLTLSGSVYNFCRLRMGNNNTLNISSRPSTTPMKIYIDTPENCGGGAGAVGALAGMGSIEIDNNSYIYYLGSGKKITEIYVAGSPTAPTSVHIHNNAGSGDSDSLLAIYAPNSTIDVHNNVTIYGSLVGKHILINNNANVIYDTSLANLTPISSSQGYTSHSFRECTGDPTGAAPDSGC